MHQYYNVLEIPVDATQEQIKWQYKQLVRIYHPDRFRNEQDKVFAEEKLRDINQAYEALSNLPKVAKENAVPVPVVTPNKLDFSTLIKGQRKSMTFRVDNLGYESQNINFIYSQPNAWFKVSNGRRIYSDKPLPMMIDVMAQTRRLAPNQLHEGWLDVVMDGVAQRVELVVQVQPRQKWSFPAFAFPKTALHKISLDKISFSNLSLGKLRPATFKILSPKILFRWGIVTLTSILIVAAMFTADLRGFLDNAQSWLPISTVGQISAIEAEQQLAFVMLDEERQPTLYKLKKDGVGTESLGISGYAPSGSPLGNEIAYISDPEGRARLFVRGQENQLSEKLYEEYPLVSQPKWSSDASWLAFMAAVDIDNSIKPELVNKLYRLDSNTKRVLPVPEVVSGEVTYFTWHTNNNSLLYDVLHENQQLIILINIEKGFGLPISQREGWTASASYDGRKIIFASHDGIIIQQRDTDNSLSSEEVLVRRIAWLPTWSPDDSQIAFLGWNDEQKLNLTDGYFDPKYIKTSPNLWVMDADSDNLIRLTDKNVLNYAWSPTGEQLVYVEGTQASKAPRLWMIDLESGQETLVVEMSTPHFTWLYDGP